MSTPLRAHAIRSRFLDFFKDRGHALVPSSSLVPQNDPTLLFTNAGMVQFKDVFVGRDHRPYSRAVSVQRCLRAGGKHNDLDNVGFTPRHHTFFEMLGNFSFGDYFKRDAIRWGWELLTEGFGIAADRLVVSVFSGEGEAAPFDQEAYELWAELIPRDRIYAFPAKENFWQMGDTGPCGPCSEIHIFHGDRAPGDASREGKFGPAYEDKRYTELWNLVFMQYEKLADGSMIALPRPSIDTGAGLERVAAVVEGVSSNYATDLAACRSLEGIAADIGKASTAVANCSADDVALAASSPTTRARRRSSIADGVMPSTAPAARYVLRRIMRRAIRHGTSKLGFDRPLLPPRICAKVVGRTSEEAVPGAAPRGRRRSSRSPRTEEAIVPPHPRSRPEAASMVALERARAGKRDGPRARRSPPSSTTRTASRSTSPRVICGRARASPLDEEPPRRAPCTERQVEERPSTKPARHHERQGDRQPVVRAAATRSAASRVHRLRGRTRSRTRRCARSRKKDELVHDGRSGEGRRRGDRAARPHAVLRRVRRPGRRPRRAHVARRQDDGDRRPRSR
jgi:hypothetical protein